MSACLSRAVMCGRLGFCAVFAATFALVGPASANPVAWLSRCVEKAEKDTLEASDEFLAERVIQCSATIVDYCEFADDPKACFEELTAEVSAENKRLLSSLPPKLGEDARQSLSSRRYAKELERLTSRRNAFECPNATPQIVCKTMNTLLRQAYLRGLAHVAGIKGEKD